MLQSIIYHNMHINYAKADSNKMSIVFSYLIWKTSHVTNVELRRFVVNTLRPRQNERRFAGDTFKHIFLNENVRISIKIALKFVPKGPINNNPSLVQIMAWRRSGDQPLSKPMMVSLLTHICVTRPQWVKNSHANEMQIVQTQRGAVTTKQLQNNQRVGAN